MGVAVELSMLKSLTLWQVLLTGVFAIALIVFLVVTQLLPGTADAYARNFVIAAVGAMFWSYLVLKHRLKNDLLYAFIPYYLGVGTLFWLPPELLPRYTSISVPVGTGFTSMCLALMLAPRLPWVARRAWQAPP